VGIGRGHQDNGLDQFHHTFCTRGYDLPGNRVILWIYIGSMMIPMQVTLVPLYILVQKLKMVDTYWALILPFLGTPWAVFVVKQFMASLPSELIESARIDGCSEWGSTPRSSSLWPSRDSPY